MESYLRAAISSYAILMVILFFGIGDAKKVTCNKKVDLAIVLDASASIGKDNYSLSKNFAKELITRFTISRAKTRVSLNYFSAHHTIVTTFKDRMSSEQLQKKVDSMFYEKSFSKLATTLEGLHYAQFVKQEGARPKKKGVKMVAIVVTDGFGTAGFEETRDKAKSMMAYHVEMFAVSPAGKGKAKTMKSLASKPFKKHLFKLDENPAKQSETVDNIVKQICSTTVV